MEILKLNKVSKVYCQKGKKVFAVNNLSFAVHKGEIFGFLGPNGAGKSTTIKMIMGLIKITQGKIFIKNTPVSLSYSRENVGYLPENPSFLESLTGKEFLVFTARMHNISKSKALEKAQFWLKKMSLTEAQDRPLRKYSKGMLQRVFFAASLIHSPDLLILDEPLSGLDPIGRYEFKTILKELKGQGKTIFFSSHILSDVEDLCDRVAIIKEGSLIKILETSTIRSLSSSNYQIIFRYSKALPFPSLNLSGDLKKIEVNKEVLWSKIETLKEMGAEILEISPIKKDLESLFVEIIKK